MFTKGFESRIQYNVYMETISKPHNTICEYCNTPFYKLPAELKRSLKSFCSKKCQHASMVTQISVVCLNCDKEFKKKKAQFEKSPNHFCSKSCAATYNNKVSPKRQPEGICSKCGDSCPNSLKHCEKCKLITILPVRGRLYYMDKTLEEASRQGRMASKFSTIREYARKVMKLANIEKKCQNCGYDKHVEVCHIKSISDFDLSTKIYEINDLSNLAYLCPNCHWEFDKGLLDLNGP